MKSAHWITLPFIFAGCFCEVNAESPQPVTDPEMFMRQQGVKEIETLFLACTGFDLITAEGKVLLSVARGDTTLTTRTLKVTLPKDSKTEFAFIQKSHKGDCHTYFGTASEFEIYGKCSKSIVGHRMTDTITINRITGEYRGRMLIGESEDDSGVYEVGTCVKAESQF